MSIDPEINDSSVGSGKIYTPSTSETPPVESTETSKPKGYQAADEMEESKSVAVPMSPSPGQPQLIMYMTDDFSSIQSIQVGEITSSILDKWSESLKEQADRVRDLLNSPLYQQLLAIHLKGHDNTATDRMKIEQPMIVNVTERLNDYLSRIGSADGSSQNMSTAPAISAIMVLGTTMVMIADPMAFSSPNSPLAAVSQVSTSMQQLVPPPVDISAALDVNLMVPLMQISWEVVVAKTAGPESKVQVATKFAEEIIKTTTTPNLMLAIVGKIPGAEKLDAKGKADLVAVLSMTMALIALTYLVKATLGGGTSEEVMRRMQEVKKMLKGEIPSDAGTDEGTLVQIIQSQQLAPATRAKAYLAIMQAIDNKEFIENIDKMSDPVHAFENVYEGLNYNAKDISNEPI